MDSLATLSILRTADTFHFQFYSGAPSPLFATQVVGSPTALYEVVTLDPGLQSELRVRLDAAVEILRLLTDSATGVAPDNEALADLGRLLYARLVPGGIQNALGTLPEDTPLLIIAKDTTIPWELLHNGRTFLALQRSLGRCLLNETLPKQAPHRPRNRPRFLIIADPRGSLPEAAREGEALLDLFDTAPDGIETDFLGPTQATPDAVSERLASGRYDLIHYAGHATSRSLLLTGGELEAARISAEMRGQPLIFLNACRTAQEDGVGALVHAFIQGGALAVLGTLWSLDDLGSVNFARRFYRQLLEGSPIGEALRKTRSHLRLTTSGPLWAYYTLYGDPRLFVLGLNRRDMRTVTILAIRIGGLRQEFAARSPAEIANLHEEIHTSLSAIARHQGGQLSTAGAGTLSIVFGLPERREDDAERAMITALEVQRALEALNRQHSELLTVPLRMQAGISSGQTISSRVKSKSGFDYQTFGEAAIIADLLAEHASPEGLLVDATSRQQSESALRNTANEQITLLYGARQISAYRVNASAQMPANAADLTRSLSAGAPFFGREQEMESLQLWWSETQAGILRFVEIIGSPGTGKSRLASFFRASIAPDRHATDNQAFHWLKAVSQAHDQGNPYALLAQIVRGLTNIDKGETEESALPKLEAAVSNVVSAAVGGGVEPRSTTLVQEGTALLSQVVGFAYMAPSIATLAPDLRQKKLTGLVQEMLRLATAEPLVLELEDLQWADDASLSVLSSALGRGERLPLLCLAIYRSSWTPPWLAHPWLGAAHRRQLHLAELDDRAQRAMLSSLLGDFVTQEDATRILSYAGGNPLFIEEMAQSLAESGMGTIQGRRELQLDRLPSRLETVIQARLDRLSPSAKDSMQLASVIGHHFEHHILSEMVDEAKRETLDNDLDEMVSRNLIRTHGSFYTGLSYEFSHALIRQVIYENLLEERRRPLHRIVGQILERQVSSQAAPKHQAPLLAHHYYHSDDRTRATRWCLAAAERAADTWDNQAALLWYGRADEVLAGFAATPPTPTERRSGARIESLAEWQLAELEGSANVLWKIGDLATAEVNYNAALSLVEQSEHLRPETRARLYYQLIHVYEAQGEFGKAWESLVNGVAALDGHETLEAARLFIWRGLIHYRRGEGNEAIIWGQRGIAIAAQQPGSLIEQAMGHNLLAVVYRNQERQAPAMDAATQSLTLYREANYTPGIERASSNLACIYQDLEEWESATELFQQTRILSEQTGEVYRLAAANMNLGEVARLQGDWETATYWYDRGYELALEHGFDEIKAISRMNIGAILLAQGRPTEAVATLEESFALFQRIESRQYLSEITLYIAEAHERLGDMDGAEESARRAAAFAKELDQEKKYETALSTLRRIHAARQS